MLTEFGLAVFVDFVLDSGSFGFKKPVYSIYFEALRHAILSAAQADRVPFVGDRPTCEVLALMMLGM